MEKTLDNVKNSFANGKYLKHDIAACFGDWLIVFDGKYNWMLFNWSDKRIQAKYNNNRLPNNSCGNKRMVEYYSSFNNALSSLGLKLAGRDTLQKALESNE